MLVGLSLLLALLLLLLRLLLMKIPVLCLLLLLLPLVLLSPPLPRLRVQHTKTAPFELYFQVSRKDNGSRVVVIVVVVVVVRLRFLLVRSFVVLLLQQERGGRAGSPGEHGRLGAAELAISSRAAGRRASSRLEGASSSESRLEDARPHRGLRRGTYDDDDEVE